MKLSFMFTNFVLFFKYVVKKSFLSLVLSAKEVAVTYPIELTVIVKSYLILWKQILSQLNLSIT